MIELIYVKNRENIQIDMYSIYIFLFYFIYKNCSYSFNLRRGKKQILRGFNDHLGILKQLSFVRGRRKNEKEISIF